MAPPKDEELYKVVTSRRRHKSLEKGSPLYITPPKDKTSGYILPNHDIKDDVGNNATDIGKGGSAEAPTKPRKRPESKPRLQKQACKVSSAKSGISALKEYGAKRGLLLESLIIEYSRTQPTPQLFQSNQKTPSIGVPKKFRFAHKLGDPFIFLNVARQWVQHLKSGDASKWCEEWGINENALKDMERYVGRHASELRSIRFKFNEDFEKADSQLLSILTEVYGDGLCIYRGHPQLGYWSVSKWRTLHLDSNSILSKLGTWNKFILVLQDTSVTDVVHGAIPISADVGQALLEKNFRSAAEILPLMTVEPVTIERIGEVMQNELLKRLEQEEEGYLRHQILSQCEGNSLILPKQHDKNNIKLFVSQKDQVTTLQLLKKAVEEIKRECETLSADVPYPNPESPVRALMSAGGKVDRILLPHEYRSILVQETDANEDRLTRDSVVRTLSAFGEIERVQQNHTSSDSGWGVVVFKDPESVHKVLVAHSTLDNMLVELMPLKASESRAPFEINQKVRATVSICRRPFNSGRASVTFRGRREYSRATEAQDFQVRGVRIPKLQPEGNGGFLLKDLHKSTTEEDVRNGLHGIGLVPDSVTLHREPPFKCVSGELEKYKSALKRLLDKVTDLRKVDVLVKRAKEEDIFLNASIVFADQRTALSSIDTLTHSKIFKLPLEIEMQGDTHNTVTVQIQKDLYEKVKVDVDHLMKVATRKLGVEIQLISPSPSWVELLITHPLPQKVNAALEQIQTLLSPTTVSISRVRSKYLLQGRGKKLLDAVMAQTNTITYWKNGKLDFYGSPLAKSDAVKLFREYAPLGLHWFGLTLADISEQAGSVCDCVAVIVGKYGASLEKLKEMCSLQHILFDDTSKSIIASSQDSDAKAALVGVLKDCCTTPCGLLNDVNSQLPECVACFCEPDSSEDAYILQDCGHVYCYECARQHTFHAINDRNFPVICAMDDCGKPLSVEDLLNLADLAFKDRRDHLIKLTVEDFTTREKENWCYCYMPYCQGLVYKDNRFEVYTCTSCSARLCKKCLQFYHTGACDDALNRRALDQWFGSDPANRKKCPCCRMGIEKIDGCNRVPCSACKKHICWVCLAYFGEMRDCYDHLTKEHGGY